MRQCQLYLLSRFKATAADQSPSQSKIAVKVTVKSVGIQLSHLESEAKERRPRRSSRLLLHVSYMCVVFVDTGQWKSAAGLSLRVSVGRVNYHSAQHTDTQAQEYVCQNSWTDTH